MPESLADRFKRETERLAGNNDYHYIEAWFHTGYLITNHFVKAPPNPIAPYGTFMDFLADDNRESRVFAARVGGIFYFAYMRMDGFSVTIYKTKTVWAVKAILVR